jgi:glycine cleavage system pyridoxal-binding protein P
VNEILFSDFDIIGGFDLGEVFNEHSCHALIAVTETVTKAEIDRLVDGLRAATR